ncbi:MAG: tRNA ligase subunit PheS family protein, partial [Armatimonadota bacterium]
MRSASWCRPPALSTPMVSELERLRREAEERIRAADSSRELTDLETRYLGRKGALTLLLRSLGSLPPDQRPTVGRLVNEAKQAVQELIEKRRAEVAKIELDAKLKAEKVDVTLPGRLFRIGRYHPISATIDEIRRVRVGLGFEFVDSPDVELYRYNFEALNYPPD